MKMTIYIPNSKRNLGNTLILDVCFQKCELLKPLSLQYFVIAAFANDTTMLHRTKKNSSNMKIEILLHQSFSLNLFHITRVELILSVIASRVLRNLLRPVKSKEQHSKPHSNLLWGMLHPSSRSTNGFPSLRDF
jgi:hypothetical protein